MMFPAETREKIAALARWMDARIVRRGTAESHAKGAVRHIVGLARLAEGDMAKVEAIIAEYVAEAWRFTGCDEHQGMTPLFAEDEIPRAQRVA